MVAVTTSRRNFPLPPLIDAITAAARSATPLPADTAAEAQLADRIRDAAVEKPSAVAPASELAAAVSGKVWQFDRNVLGIKSLMLDLKAATPGYEIVFGSNDSGAAAKPLAGPIGLDGLFRINDKAANAPVAVKGDWLDAQSFRIVSRELGEDMVATYTLRFDGQRVNVAFENNRGFKVQMQGRAAE